MAYQQHSIRQQPLRGIEQGFSRSGQDVPQQGQFQQQPQLQQQPHLQQLPGASTQAIGQPVAEQAWTAPQQMGPSPQQMESSPQQTGQLPQQATIPQTTPQGPAQQLSPQTQQLPLQAQQSPVSPPQQQFGQPQGRVGHPGIQQPLSASIQPQAQTSQSLGQQAGGQQTPQAQWSMQGSGQPSGLQGMSPSQSPTTGQSLESTPQSFPAQTAELRAGSVRQTGEPTQQAFAGSPNIDVVDTPDEIVLSVDLPGYDEENIRIQADGQNLMISAERRDEERGEGRTFAQERPQKLQRTIQLPARANVNEADATYENGVCKISLPKMEDEKQHEIAFQ